MATRPASSDVGVTGRAAILAGLWLAVVGVAGATGVNRWSRLVWLTVTAVVPLGAFVLAWWRSARFRATVVDWDLLVLTWLESRRVPVGIGLLVFYQEGRLHGRRGLARGLAGLPLGLTTPLVARGAPSEHPRAPGPALLLARRRRGEAASRF